MTLVEILYKRTFVWILISKDPISSIVPHQHILLVPNVMPILSTYLAKSAYLSMHDGLAKYLYLLCRHILDTAADSRHLWVLFQQVFDKRRFKASRGSVFLRYRRIFPKGYTEHAHLLEALYIAVQYRNLSYLVYYLQRMFKIVNFFKHKFLLYFFRAAFVNLNHHNVPRTRGLFIKFRGKLSQAGNSRRKRFLVGYGQISTGYGSLYAVEKFQIKTFTGAIGCTIILSYT